MRSVCTQVVLLHVLQGVKIHDTQAVELLLLGGWGGGGGGNLWLWFRLGSLRSFLKCNKIFAPLCFYFLCLCLTHLNKWKVSNQYLAMVFEWPWSDVGIFSLLLWGGGGGGGGGVRSLKLCMMIVPVKLYISICSGNLDACTRSHTNLKE